MMMPMPATTARTMIHVMPELLIGLGFRPDAGVEMEADVA
jgi:hypothetical protein